MNELAKTSNDYSRKAEIALAKKPENWHGLAKCNSVQKELKMNNKTKIICTIALLIANSFLATSIVCFVKTYNEYEKRHDELLKRGILGSKWATKCEQEEQEMFDKTHCEATNENTQH